MKKQLILAAALFCFVPSDGASSAPACLTAKEARDKYPRSHLYWATADRCWGNYSVRGRKHFRPRKTIDATAAYARGQIPTNQDAFDKTPTTQSHKIIDLDAKLKECCWPVLDVDANGNPVEPPMAFAERIKDVPLQWWEQSDGSHR